MRRLPAAAAYACAANLAPLRVRFNQCYSSKAVWKRSEGAVRTTRLAKTPLHRAALSQLCKLSSSHTLHSTAYAT